MESLPDHVYISLDIDGLSPDLCPNTGTPVPGGLTFQQVDYLAIPFSRFQPQNHRLLTYVK